MRRLLTSLVWVGMVCCVTASASAQSAIGGIVKDANGRVVAGARVTVTDPITQREVRRTVSSPIGHYEVAKLRSGPYTITVEAEFYEPFVGQVELVRHIMGRLDVVLVIRHMERITVRGDTASTLPAASGDLAQGATFSRSAIESMPLPSGRTVQSILALVPGIVVTDSVGTLAQFTAVGQRRFANRMTIDGISADLALDVRGPGIGEAASGALPALSTSGGTQTIVPLDAIREIQVRTTNASPEHARSPGAQTIVVTRAGGDRLAATGFGTVRPKGLAASDWFTNAGLAPRRENALDNLGASIGGPVLPERVQYFATWEHQRIARPVRTTIQVPSRSSREAAPPALRPLLDAFPLPNGADVGGGLADYSDSFGTRSALWSLSLRGDAQLSPRHRFFARFNVGDSSGDALSAPTQRPFLSYASRERASAKTLTGAWTSVIGASATNELRANISTADGAWRNRPATSRGAHDLPVAESVTMPNADTTVFATVFPGPTGTTSAGRITASRQRQLQFANTFAAVKGRHSLRAGFDYTRVVTATGGALEMISYRFGNLVNMLEGRPPQASVTTYLPAQIMREFGAVFVQDTFRVSPGITLEYGLRYSLAPAPVNQSETDPLLLSYRALPKIVPLPAASRLWRTSKWNIAPRLGAVFRPGTATDRTTIIRAVWGLVFDELTSPGGLAFGRGYPFVTTRQTPAAHFPLRAGDLPEAPAPFSAGDTSDYFSFADDLRRPRTYEWQIGLDQEFSAAQRLALAYVGAAGRGLIYWHAYPASNTRTAINAYSNAGRSDYAALLVDYTHRQTRGVQLKAIYTWSHAIDNDSGERTAPNPPPMWVAPAANRGSADFDRRHVFHLAGTYHVPRPRLPRTLQVFCDGWSVDAAVTLRGGAPVSVLWRRILNGGSYVLGLDYRPGVETWLADPASPGGRRINPDAFSVPGADRQGTFGRNAVRASVLRQVDVAVSRSAQFGRVSAHLRIEFFNVFNTPHFGPPDGVYGSSVFGRSIQSYADSQGTGTLTRGGLAPLQQVGGPRTIQIGIRFGI